MNFRSDSCVLGGVGVESARDPEHPPLHVMTNAATTKTHLTSALPTEEHRGSTRRKLTFERVRNGVFCASAIGLCATLLLSTGVHGYTFLGGSLDLTQRDVRVFNNFSGALANDNTTPDPSFPGAVGAPLAIWKAAVEWGSEPHGDGQGDPTQPGTLGSGGANFDFVWQGLATSVGGLDDNIVSEIPGTSIGILAFTETPIQDGWRMRFYGGAGLWEDGPNPPAPIQFHEDIQGVATHELGHALGLNHSGISGVTMFPSGSGTNAEKRTIEADDIAGCQALYGVKSASKPHVSTYSLAGNSVTIVGAHFAATNNEVWFVDGSATADGTPLKVTNLAASVGGTQITLAIPPLALAGDVFVHVPGTSGDTLSNAFPFDPTMPPCPAPILYGTPKMTSQGTLPSLYVFGRPNASTNDFQIGTDGGISGATGILFSGGGLGSNAFFGGTLYVSRPYKRHSSFVFDFLGGTAVSVPVTPAMIGTTRFFQMWFQDAGDPFGVGLSNGVQVTFCP